MIKTGGGARHSPMDIMNQKNGIMLVNLPLAEVSTTPFFVMPISLLSIAAYLLQHDYPVNVVDFNVIRRQQGNCTDDELLKKFTDLLIKDRPSLVGFSIMVAGQFTLANDASKIVKQVSPSTIIAVGGAHVSQFPKEILAHCENIDAVVIGEGEVQSLMLAHYAQTGKFPKKSVNGIAYREDDDIVVKPKASYIAPLDKLPFPSFELLNFEDYLHDASTWHNPYKIDFGVRVPVITSRGCPNLCTFCSVSHAMGQRYRPMSAKRVVDMLHGLYETKGVHTFVIYDANFAQDYKRVLAICEGIQQRNMKLTLDLPTGLPLNATTKEMIDGLVSVGLIRTCVSVESGDIFIRNDVMKKTIKEEEILDAIASIRKYKQLFLMTDFVIGMPEETVESLESSVRFIEQLDTDDIDLSICTPYPGTALYAQCVRDGLFNSDVNIDSLYCSAEYTHSNRNKFTIKPYQLSYDILCDYRDKILSMRKYKIKAYHNRMKEAFDVISEYKIHLV